MRLSLKIPHPTPLWGMCPEYFISIFEICRNPGPRNTPEAQIPDDEAVKDSEKKKTTSAGNLTCVRERGRLKNFLWLFRRWSIAQFSKNGATSSLVQVSRVSSSQVAIKLSWDTVLPFGNLLRVFCAKKSFTMSRDSSSLRSIRTRCASVATISRGLISWPCSLLNLFAIHLTSFLASINDNLLWRVSLSAVSHLRGSFLSKLESSIIVRTKKKHFKFSGRNDLLSVSQC